MPHEEDGEEEGLPSGVAAVEVFTSDRIGRRRRRRRKGDGESAKECRLDWHFFVDCQVSHMIFLSWRCLGDIKGV